MTPDPLELAVFGTAGMATFPLETGASLTIGRAPSCDVAVDDPSVSRRHAVLHVGVPVRIEDLGGANGTFVRDGAAPNVSGQTRNLRRLTGETVTLRVGDSVMVGSTVLVLRRRETSGPDGTADRIVAQSPAMVRVRQDAARAALGDLSVLILGETGVGKEVLARFIHQASPRRDRPFLGINCGALSESLFESELFGHEKGSFTGAQSSRAGLLESAEGGTVLLDEVGELSPRAQVKLLRVLEEREVLRIGARIPRRVDVRFIAATNQNVRACMAKGTFRTDLYYRLGAVILKVPPLRERPEAIPALVERFVVHACAQLGREQPPQLADETLALMMRHSWPGNVRELRNVVERAVVMADGPVIGPQWLPELFEDIAPDEPGVSPDFGDDRARRLRQEMADLERERIVDALERTGGNQSRAAELLGISRRTLVTKLGLYDLPRPRRR